MHQSRIIANNLSRSAQQVNGLVQTGPSAEVYTAPMNGVIDS